MFLTADVEWCSGVPAFSAKFSQTNLAVSVYQSILGRPLLFLLNLFGYKSSVEQVTIFIGSVSSALSTCPSNLAALILTVVEIGIMGVSSNFVERGGLVITSSLLFFIFYFVSWYVSAVFFVFGIRLGIYPFVCVMSVDVRSLHREKLSEISEIESVQRLILLFCHGSRF